MSTTVGTKLIRSMLCIFDCWSTGEGTFGRVLQAKAQGIVEGKPDKNVVAIKMCRGKAVSFMTFWRLCYD